MIRMTEWILLAACMGGFVVCIISDYVGLRAKKRLATVLFLAGTGLIVAATAYGLLACVDFFVVFAKAPILKGLAAAGGLIFMILTAYTLIAVPKENYTESNTGKLMDTGAYALCRHPGVLCLAGTYLFFGLMADSLFIWMMCALNVAMDIIYVILQDIYIFPKTIAGYEAYKTRTPFLIPTIRSVKRALGEKKNTGVPSGDIQ